MGHLLVAEIDSMIETLKFFHEDYWWDYNFNFIPSPLLRRLIKLKGWTILQDDIATIYEYNREAHEKALLSHSINILLAVQPHYSFKLYFEILDSGGSLSVVYSSDIFNKIKEDNSEELQKLISNKRFRLYTCPELRDLFYLYQCDSLVFLRPLTNNGTVGNIRLMNSSPEAVQWGREVFEYYFKGSTLITEI